MRAETDTFLFFARNYIKQVQGLLEKSTVFMDQETRKRRAKFSYSWEFYVVDPGMATGAPEKDCKKSAYRRTCSS